MAFLKKTGALVVMLMMTCTALPIMSVAETIPDPCSEMPCPPPPPPPGTDGVEVVATTTESTLITLQLGTNFVPGDPITYATTSDPTDGVLGMILDDGTVTYTPNTSFTGADFFTYNSTQGADTSSDASVTIFVVALAPLDSMAPVITAPPMQDFSTTTIPAFPVLVEATATDETDPSPVITSDAPPSFPVGTTTIIWTATDASGNFSTTTSEIGITLVDQYRISSDKAAATTTESFTATALSFDGTSAYIPASGALIGVVLSSDTSIIATTSIADANGQVTFTVDTAGSYLIGLEADLYATTTPITITEVIPDPTPTPTPTPVAPAGNGPPVASAPVNAAPSAVTPTSTPAPEPSLAYTAAAADVLTPTPITDATPAPEPGAEPLQPRVLAAETEPVVSEPTEITPAPIETPAIVQMAAAAAPVTSSKAYNLLWLLILFLALVGTWQWKKRRGNKI